MYHAIAFLCANEWTSILELSEEDMEERKELFSVRFEMIYGIPNDLTVLSDFTDRVSALAIYIAKYMTNTLSSVDENSKKGCYVTMKNYVDTIFGIIKKDFGNLPDASFKAMLPVILPLLFAVNYLDYDSDSDTVPYYFIASSINIGKYHLWRLKHANVACPICDAMDIAVRQIESVHCEAKVTYIDNRDYPLFYLTLLLNDLEQKDFNPFFSLAATIFQTLFDFWMQKYDIPSVLN